MKLIKSIYTWNLYPKIKWSEVWWAVEKAYHRRTSRENDIPIKSVRRSQSPFIIPIPSYSLPIKLGRNNNFGHRNRSFPNCYHFSIRQNKTLYFPQKNLTKTQIPDISFLNIRINGVTYTFSTTELWSCISWLKAKATKQIFSFISVTIFLWALVVNEYPRSVNIRAK